MIHNNKKKNRNTFQVFSMDTAPPSFSGETVHHFLREWAMSNCNQLEIQGTELKSKSGCHWIWRPESTLVMITVTYRNQQTWTWKVSLIILVGDSTIVFQQYQSRNNSWVAWDMGIVWEKIVGFDDNTFYTGNFSTCACWQIKSDSLLVIKIIQVVILKWACK